MTPEAQQIALHVCVTALVSCGVGGFLSMLPVMRSGSLARATRVGGMAALRRTIRKTVLWTGVIGTITGFCCAWYFITRDPLEQLTMKQYLLVAIGSGIAGFVVGMGFFGFFCDTGESV